jgi:hypothetical protein
MESPQTLHDFVLNLLSNADARAAFQLDPQGALHDAGLSDIDASDVRDVIPLVVDYAPTRTMPALDTTLSQLTTTAGPAGAIQQLQLVTQQLPPVLPTDVTMAATGAVAGTASLAGSGDLSPVNDVAHTLDATAITDTTSTVTNTVTSTLSGVTGTPDLSHPLSTVPDISHVLGGGGGGILDLSGVLGGSGAVSGTGGSLDAHAHAHAEATTHTDNPLQHGVVGDLLGGATNLLGAPDGHPLDVSHLF